MELGEYLSAARTKPWGWRSHDCCTFPARWAQVPLPDYSNEAEAEAMLHAAGGLVPLFERAAQGHAEPTDLLCLEPGDVGVIELPAGDATMVECGAIWTGKRWAFVPARGGVAATASASCLKAWRPRWLKP
jgi:hypothetical protein